MEDLSNFTGLTLKATNIISAPKTTNIILTLKG